MRFMFAPGPQNMDSTQYIYSLLTNIISNHNLFISQYMHVYTYAHVCLYKCNKGISRTDVNILIGI